MHMLRPNPKPIRRHAVSPGCFGFRTGFPLCDSYLGIQVTPITPCIVRADYDRESVGMKLPVTVIILTYNEATNIAQCLSAVRDFSEVVVVDSGSMDQTVDIISREFPDVTVLTNAFLDFGQQRNWALDNTGSQNDWVLFVDADEFLEQPLVDEIAEFVRSPGPYVGGYIAGRNYFMGRWLKRTSFFPSYQLRLLKRGEVRYRKEGHGQREVTNGELKYLRNTWRHEAFSQGIYQWIKKHNDYSSNEIELIVRLRSEKISLRKLFFGDAVSKRREMKKLLNRLPGRPLLRFIHSYVLKFGFLDGYAGWIYSLLRFSHDCHIVAKVYEYEYQQKKKKSELN